MLVLAQPGTSTQVCQQQQWDGLIDQKADLALTQRAGMQAVDEVWTNGTEAAQGIC